MDVPPPGGQLSVRRCPAVLADDHHRGGARFDLARGQRDVVVLRRPEAAPAKLTRFRPHHGLRSDPIAASRRCGRRTRSAATPHRAAEVAVWTYAQAACRASSTLGDRLPTTSGRLRKTVPTALVSPTQCDSAARTAKQQTSANALAWSFDAAEPTPCVELLA